jgi:hypothetical protein
LVECSEGNPIDIDRQQRSKIALNLLLRYLIVDKTDCVGTEHGDQWNMRSLSLHFRADVKAGSETVEREVRVQFDAIRSCRQRHSGRGDAFDTNLNQWIHLDQLRSRDLSTKSGGQ